MSTEFKREERYLVFKLSDVEEHFTPSERQQLARLAEVQRVGRSESGKPLLECVVIEADWPEYEQTWNAIEVRMTGTQPAPSVPEGWKLVPIEPTPGMMRAALCALVDTRGNSALFRATLNRWIATIFTPCLSWCQVCLRCDPTFGRSNQ